MENINPVNQEQRGGSKYTQEQRKEWIELWRASGQRQKEFCGEHNLKYLTFVSWVCKNKKAEKERNSTDKKIMSFTELKVVAPPSSFAEITFKQCSVSIFHPVTSDFLRALID